VIQVIPAKERYYSEIDWLKSYWHFSFDHYYDPNNRNFGNLRVFNEDWIKPGTGFGMHPHRDMEIVTFVVSGELTHEDSMGNKGLIRAGEVQRMTAGTGVFHSEYNHSPDTTVHLLQMWVFPNQTGLTPSWEQKPFTMEQRKNNWLPVVSGTPKGEALSIHQDVTFYVSSLDAGRELSHELGGKPAYLFVIKGSVKMGDQTLSTGDQVKMVGEDRLVIKAETGSELILIEV
jgi:redox-sensitive bicupin YhaK (pirin superfamily)